MKKRWLVKYLIIVIIIFGIIFFSKNIELKDTYAEGITLAQTVINSSKGSSWNSGASGVYSTNNGQDYRYIGANVDNWVRFNDDYYRIIGVFDENTHGVEGQQLVKLIMAQKMGTSSWGAYNESNNSGTYVACQNDWTGNNTGVKANLNVLLNEFYYNKTNFSDTYGKCANWTNYLANNDYKTFDCANFKRYGLTEESRSYIQETEWNLYGFNSNSLSKAGWYACERGLDSSCTSAASGTYANKTIANVGLMYVSDYLYACSYYGSSDTSSGNIYYFGNQNWLFNGYEWTITPASHNNDSAFGITIGFVYFSTTDNPFAIRPSFYLKSSVYVTGGDGTVENPYTIGYDPHVDTQEYYQQAAILAGVTPQSSLEATLTNSTVCTAIAENTEAIELMKTHYSTEMTNYIDSNFNDGLNLLNYKCKLKCYLFKNGNSCTNITGGWTGTIASVTLSSSTTNVNLGSITNNQLVTDFSADARGCEYLRTANNVDRSEYSKVGLSGTAGIHPMYTYTSSTAIGTNYYDDIVGSGTATLSSFPTFDSGNSPITIFGGNTTSTNNRESYWKVSAMWLE